MNRRRFLKQSAFAAAGVAATATGCRTTGSTSSSGRRQLFKISLAEWSFHRAISTQKTMTNLDFPVKARREFGIEAVEYVNQFFMDKADDANYLAELKRRCDGEGVRSVLIMCDREGALGDADPAKRKQAVENHHKWAQAAKFLGCHSIRVNAQSSGTYDEQVGRATEGLFLLASYCRGIGLNTIVENHGGLSSNGQWLASVIRKVNLPNCGTLPDFGNFVINRETGEEYDRYKGVAELMPFAKGVSAKSNAFDASGNETKTDFRRMMKIVLAAGYHGHVGIEYEGDKLSEADGVRATKVLLERVRQELSAKA